MRAEPRRDDLLPRKGTVRRNFSVLKASFFFWRLHETCGVLNGGLLFKVCLSRPIGRHFLPASCEFDMDDEDCSWELSNSLARVLHLAPCDLSPSYIASEDAVPADGARCADCSVRPFSLLRERIFTLNTNLTPLAAVPFLRRSVCLLVSRSVGRSVGLSIRRAGGRSVWSGGRSVAQLIG
jgi:hypothetical protein